MVPEILTIEEKVGYKSFSSEILNTTENDSKFVEEMVACDEYWFFTYDSEMKHQSMH